MPKFNNQDNKAFVLLPAGDYVFRVTALETGLQTGTGKTAGSPFWELTLEIEDKGAKVFERLIDHETCNWKIDTFLKSTGAAPPVGTAFEFSQEAAESSGCLWIDPIGLRGWCHLIVDSYQKTGAKETTKRNKVGTFLTDRPKLPRIAAAEPETPAEPAAVDDDGLPF